MRLLRGQSTLAPNRDEAKRAAPEARTTASDLGSLDSIASASGRSSTTRSGVPPSLSPPPPTTSLAEPEAMGDKTGRGASSWQLGGAGRGAVPFGARTLSGQRGPRTSRWPKGRRLVTSLPAPSQGAKYCSWPTLALVASHLANRLALSL